MLLNEVALKTFEGGLVHRCSICESSAPLGKTGRVVLKDRKTVFRAPFMRRENAAFHTRIFRKIYSHCVFFVCIVDTCEFCVSTDSHSQPFDITIVDPFICKHILKMNEALYYIDFLNFTVSR